jgi:hypothetical protein
MPQLQHPGKYKATVKAVKFGESSKKGTPFIELALETDDHFTIDTQLYLSGNAFEYSVETLRKCFGFDDNFDTAEGQLVGGRCSITCEMEPFTTEKGEVRETLKVKWINPENQGAKPIANQSEFLKSLSAKASRIARPEGLPAPRPVAPKPAANDEDVPF